MILILRQQGLKDAFWGVLSSGFCKSAAALEMAEGTLTGTLTLLEAY